MARRCSAALWAALVFWLALDPTTAGGGRNGTAAWDPDGYSAAGLCSHPVAQAAVAQVFRPFAEGRDLIDLGCGACTFGP